LRIVETYLPGTACSACYLCRASQRLIDEGRTQRRELVVDTGRSIDFEGGLALCETCIREMARLVGMVDAGLVIDVEEALIEARSARAAAEAERDEAVATADALRRWDGSRRAEDSPANGDEGAGEQAADAPAAAPRKRTARAAR
jgi:hypothetical protein